MESSQPVQITTRFVDQTTVQQSEVLSSKPSEKMNALSHRYHQVCLEVYGLQG
jgi:hypothetical protein